MIDVWTVSFAEAAPEYLTPPERQRAGRLRKDQQRALWIRVRSRLRELLGERLGVPPLEVRFVQMPGGKPIVMGGPHFSVSHSAEYGLIAICDYRSIGVDIECHRPTMDLDAVACRVLAAEEQLHMAKLPTEARTEAFCRLWVRKEAALKAVGMGIAAGLSGFTVLDEYVPPLGVSVADLPAPQGYSAAVAALGVTPPTLRIF